MPEEQNGAESCRAIALQSLKHELELAIRLLHEVKDARELMSMETNVINAARDAFRHAVDALPRLPMLTSEDMDAVQRLIDDFRSALAELNH